MACILYVIDHRTGFRTKTSRQNGNTNKLRKAPVNGINMYYKIYGQGDMPLVLIHRDGSTIQTSFAVLLPLLAGDHKL